MHGGVQFVTGHDSNELRAVAGGAKRDRPGDQRDVMSGRERSFRNRVAHFARRAIADEANRIDRLRASVRR